MRKVASLSKKKIQKEISEGKQLQRAVLMKSRSCATAQEPSWVFGTAPMEIIESSIQSNDEQEVKEGINSHLSDFILQSTRKKNAGPFFVTSDC